MTVASEAKSDNETVPGTVFTPRQVRVLKWVVIVLGALLVGCFALVIFAIVYQAMQLGQDAPPSGSGNAAIADGGAAVSASPPVGAIPVSADQSVAGMTMQGNRLAIHLKGADTEEIAVVDVQSGQVLRRFRITPR